MGVWRAKDTIGVIKQSAWNAGIITGMRIVPVTAAPTWTFNGNDFMSNRHRVSGSANIKKKGQYSYGVEIPMELDSGDSLFFWDQLLGDYTYNVDTPVASANQHIMFPTSTAADIAQMYTKGFTFGTSGADDTKGAYAEDCIITKIEIPETENGAYPMNVSIMASDKVDGVVATTGSVNDAGTLLDSVQAVVSAGVDSSEVAQSTTVASIVIERGGIVPAYRSASNVAKRWSMNEGSFLTVTGTFEIEVSDATYAAVADDFENSDEFSLQLVFTSNEFITGSTPYSLTFDMPECKYTSHEGRTDGHLRYIKYGWEAGISGGTNIVTLTAVSNKTTLA